MISTKHVPFLFNLIIIVVASFAFVRGQFPQSNYVFVHSKILMEPDVYKMNWNYTDTQVIVELQVKTNGWLGFGITKSGGMDGADVIVAWVDTYGNANFTDRHIIGRNVIIDKEQNWFLISSKKSNGYTIIVFTRNIKACDPNGEDIDIEQGTPRVIFSWNNNLPSSDISYHGPNNRGIATIPFISSLNEEISFSAEDNIQIYNFTVNATIPDGIDTYYHCEMFKLPLQIIQTKHHLLRFESVISPSNLQYVHHWLLYYCQHQLENTYLVNNSIPLPGNCDDAPWQQTASYCRVLGGIWAWTIDTRFPKDLGFPYGGNESEFSYFYLQIHYSNPQKLSGIKDQTTLRLYFTQKLRKQEIGILQVGAMSTWIALLIPPGQDSFSFSFSSRKDCLSRWYNNNNITVFAVAPHTHLAGKQVYTKLIRNGKEIAYLDKSLNYDFNYQIINYLQTPIAIQPGDELRTTCVYKTTDRTTYTYGGMATYNEMLSTKVYNFNFIVISLDFIFYYPKTANIASCLSYYNNLDWYSLLLYLNQTGNIKLSPGIPTYDSATYDVMTSLNSNNDVTAALTYFFNNARQTQNCEGTNFYNQTDYPQLTSSPLEEVDACVPIVATTQPTTTTTIKRRCKAKYN